MYNYFLNLANPCELCWPAVWVWVGQPHLTHLFCCSLLLLHPLFFAQSFLQKKLCFYCTCRWIARRGANPSAHRPLLAQSLDSPDLLSHHCIFNSSSITHNSWHAYASYVLVGVLYNLWYIEFCLQYNWIYSIVQFIWFTWILSSAPSSQSLYISVYMSYWESEMDRLSYIHRWMYDNAVECATIDALNANIQWHCRVINNKDPFQ